MERKNKITQMVYTASDNCRFFTPKVTARREAIIVVVQKRSVIPTFFSTTTYAAIPYFRT